MRTARGDVGKFLDAFDEVGRVKEDGATHKMGPDGQEVKSPARYDLFAALSDLVATARGPNADPRHPRPRQGARDGSESV